MQQKSNFKLSLSQLKSVKSLNKWLLLDLKGSPGKSTTNEVLSLKMTILVLPEIEFILFLADGTRPCFGFSVRIMLITLKKITLKKTAVSVGSAALTQVNDFTASHSLQQAGAEETAREHGWTR